MSNKHDNNDSIEWERARDAAQSLYDQNIRLKELLREAIKILEGQGTTYVETSECMNNSEKLLNKIDDELKE